MSEFEYLTTGAPYLSQPISQVIHSNAREIIKQQEYVFESFWDRAVPAKTPGDGDRRWQGEPNNRSH